MVRVLLGSIMGLILMNTLLIVSAVPDCSLDVRNSDGSPISIIGSGVPFQLIVTMRNCNEQPQVTFDETPFSLLRCVSIQTRIINGNSSLSYVYSARIDTVGSYEVGPARVNIGGVAYNTNSCTVEVGAHEKTVGARFIAELCTDDTDLFIGQETTVRVRIYSALSAPEVESLHVSKVDGIVVGEFQQGSAGSEVRDGVRYRYKEFTAPLYANKIGTFTLPAYSADIRDDHGVRRNSFFFFSAIAPTKQIHSNTISLTVTALPKSDMPYALIGNYQEAIATVEPAIITLGQAIKYRITVFGMGNSALAKTPLLADMPSACKYYDSSITELSDEDGIVFEYIVQPRQPGTWEIPAQEIMYFNPTTEEYHTLLTAPIAITAQEPVGTDSQKFIEQKSAQSSDAVLATSVQKYHPDLSAASPMHALPMQIPWFWYWFCMACMVIIVIGMQVYTYCFAVYLRNYQAYRRYYAFYTARMALKRLEQRPGSRSLHDIFVVLFSDYYGVDPSLVTEQFIHDHLITTGLLSADGIHSWCRFWHQVVQAQYGNLTTKKLNATIYTEARLWITAFSKMGTR